MKVVGEGENLEDMRKQTQGLQYIWWVIIDIMIMKLLVLDDERIGLG
jgi:hypothetical protein